MEMVAEGVLAPSTNMSRCMVNPTFTVEMEGRPSKEVENAFFLALVPIGQHDTPLLVSRFPRANRDGLMAMQRPSVDALKQQILRYVCIYVYICICICIGVYV